MGKPRGDLHFTYSKIDGPHLFPSCRWQERAKRPLIDSDAMDKPKMTTAQAVSSGHTLCARCVRDLEESADAWMSERGM